MNTLFPLFFLLLCRVGVFAEKVLIITSAYNRPDFIEIQYHTLNKFLQDDYEFVVFNDANDPSLRSAIKNMSTYLGIRCINIPQSIHELPYLERWPGEGFHNPAVRNANVVQYALNHLGFAHNGIVAILDSDIFLVRPFSIKEFLKGYDLGGVLQGYSRNGIEIPYLWIGIAFLDMERLPDKEQINFNCGKIKGVPVDAGGYTYHYLRKHPELKIKYFSAFHSATPSCSACKSIQEHYPCSHNRETFLRSGLDENQVNFLQAGLENVEFFIQGTFFHYRGGTNWDHKTRKFHENKTRLFNAYIQKILEK